MKGERAKGVSVSGSGRKTGPNVVPASSPAGKGGASLYPAVKPPTEQELLARLQQGENAQTEFKQRLPQGPGALRTLVALANTDGGWLILGVDDRGGILGLGDPSVTRRVLEDSVRERIAPPIALRFVEFVIAGRSVLVCLVPRGKEVHRLEEDAGKAVEYVRLGASSRRAQGPALRALKQGARRHRPANALEAQVLDWLARRGPHQDGSRVDDFAREHNIGMERARRAFVHLELAGAIIGSGHGKRRAYTLARTR